MSWGKSFLSRANIRCHACHTKSEFHIFCDSIVCQSLLHLLTILLPHPLDFKVVDTRKSDVHVLSEEGKKTLENEDPLSEYYAQVSQG
ncbi:hypothetical protein JVU11DRAFT_11390 [Chiua virens]|nr:hypothetical protein JVU11DRAFT_11390 [Chiua virens]